MLNKETKINDVIINFKNGSISYSKITEITDGGIVVSQSIHREAVVCGDDKRLTELSTNGGLPPHLYNYIKTFVWTTELKKEATDAGIIPPQEQ